MSFGSCLVCEKPIFGGPVVIAEVISNEVVSYAHGQCWVDSGRKVLLPPGDFNNTLDNSWLPESAIDWPLKQAD